MLEKDILYKAIENLERLTQTSIQVEDCHGDNVWDARVSLPINNGRSRLNVEIRKEVHRSNLAEVLEEMSAGGLLVARYISAPGKAILRERQVNYLELLGDCYVRTPEGIFWFLQGQPAPAPRQGRKHRAFHKNGIKLVFALLVEPDLLNATYREMAALAGISASTVGSILKDLLDSGYLLKRTQDEKIWNDRQGLLAQWVHNYNEVMRPKQYREKYRFSKEEARRNWREMVLPATVYWGGEPAADLYTDFLMPGAWMVYTPLNRKEVVQKMRLIPDPDGEVTVYDPFWGEGLNAAVKGNRVHPILVYADLLSTEKGRNLEIAQKLYEQEIENIL